MEDLTQTPRLQIEEQIDRVQKAFEQRMALSIAHDLNFSSALDRFRALAFAIRDELIKKWLKTQETYYRKNPKRIYYFSLEYLIGRTLSNALINLDLADVVENAMDGLGSWVRVCMTGIRNATTTNAKRRAAFFWVKASEVKKIRSNIDGLRKMS